MQEDVKELVAVVTGGTRGIGLGIAESLVKRGAHVAITYKENEKAAELARQHLEELSGARQRILLLKGDVGDSSVDVEHHRKVVGKLGSVNILINNAGMMVKQSIEEISFSEWDRVIQINLNSAFYWSKMVIPGMKAMRFGRIINISSIAARMGGMIAPHYAASKAGVLGLTKYAARELGKFGITVNAIAPAFISDSGFFASWSEEAKKTLLDKVIVSRLGNVNDVVRAFEYLLDSPFITGATVDVNGGAFIVS